ncbi:uncharacterized protein L969DRAFT_49570 [Mixia osmundae IAM 14324]|uniref:Helicase ATP-binding domain-containing protein n=1 Tax=Mixia osmundae (strain CBS 9802 / IAM 14324 / JCM 22182 / KY 12970) TaxID=764103 RepID=G7E397_MIXOS|nr:uncharacterized protein L969DRAFT_49570 [Mixia osmundae IAM 14324]KEI39294.1 hypothetical protein L969DRAFT_49570 [Mixia osmundae IAM 14324]GAA97307.1 hypothetical protein E5Q_03985 [Mixia osmundae IAM 14324]
MADPHSNRSASPDVQIITKPVDESGTAAQKEPANPYSNRLALPSSSMFINRPFKSPLPANGTMSTDMMSYRDRAQAQVHSFHKAMGVPIKRPEDTLARASYSVPQPAASTSKTTIDLTNDPIPELDGMRLQDENEQHLRELVETLSDLNDVDMSRALPEDMTCKLLPHQVQGVQWMRAQEDRKLYRGGILGDDMGLGKTVQSLALIVGNRPTVKPRGTLIVAPLALIRQWESEIRAKIKPDTLRVLVHHGPSRTRDAHKMGKYHVVITTYEVVLSEYVPDSEDVEVRAIASDSDDSVKMVRTKSKRSGPLFETAFHRIILDEAHTIKNRLAKKSKACFDLVASFRWCLTGTPIQNSIEDLYSLFKFLRVKPLDDLAHFKSKFVTPMKANKQSTAAMETAIKRIRVVLAAVMLRRTKTSQIDGKPIITLPQRIVQLRQTPFTDKQELDFYVAVEERVQKQYKRLAKDSSNIQTEYIAILQLLLRLRQACNHPKLLGKAFEDDSLEAAPSAEPVKDDSVDDLADLLSGVGLSSKCSICQEPCRGQMCSSCQQEMDEHGNIGSSTKMRKLVRILRTIRDRNPKHKTIVFSQFVTFLDLVGPHIEKAGFKYVRYHGSMNNTKREASLDKIRNDPDVSVILISLKCGALGLNLTACCNVIMSDLWWNPAVEEQAIDRAHRFGQIEDVNVYKLVIEGTVEDRILKLQDDKRQIAQAALGSGDASKLNKLSAKDIMYLFRG